MGFSYNVNVLNQKGSPALYTDTFANRPNFGYAGRLFIANDTSAIYEDTGTAWVLIANVSSGAGTLQQVTTNGNTSNVGISVTAGGVSTNSLTDTALTLGSVPFTGAGGLITQDNANFFWDDTNNRLGINTNTPGNSLDVHTSGTNPILALNNTAGSQSAISFLNTSVAKWRIGNTSTNTFDIFNFGLNNHAIRINSGDNSIEITNDIFVQSNGSIIGSNANGTTPLRIQCNNINKAIQFLNPATGTADFYVSGTSTSTAYRFSTYSTVDSFVIENNGDTKTKSISYAEEFILNSATYGTLAALTRNLIAPGIGILQLKNSAFAYIQPTTLTVDRTYTLPDATGTLALTSNLSAYLPLAGGTLTGNLNGTTANLGNTNGSVGILNVTGRIACTSSLFFSSNLTSEDRWEINGSSNSQLEFTKSGTGLLMQIASTGQVRIGTTTASIVSASGLVVNDPIVSKAANSGLYTQNRASSNFFGLYGNTNLIVYNSDVGTIGTFAYNTGVYTPLSDINKKKDFENSQIGLNAILNLKPTLYRMISENENSDKHLGFIAQEVKDFIPEAYIENGDGKDKFIGLDYQAITATLVKAIQDQQFIINTLLKRIELLENK